MTGAHGFFVAGVLSYLVPFKSCGPGKQGRGGQAPAAEAHSFLLGPEEQFQTGKEVER